MNVFAIVDIKVNLDDLIALALIDKFIFVRTLNRQ
jgi:hypothetical protein